MNEEYRGKIKEEVMMRVRAYCGYSVGHHRQNGIQRTETGKISVKGKKHERNSRECRAYER